MSSQVASGEQEGERSATRGIPFKSLGKRFMAEFKSDDLPGMAAEIAYHLVFAIPPILILLVTVAAVLNNFTDVPVVENLQRTVEERAPADLKPVLDSAIDTAIEKSSGGLASLGAAIAAVVALWSASNAVSALMKGLNRTFDVEEGRSAVRKKLVALGLTLLFIVLVNGAFALFVFGQQIGAWIAEKVGLGTVFTIVWNIARWPVAVICVMLLLALLYYLGPYVEQSFRWASPGSVLSTALWVVVVLGINLYLSFSNPGSAYGAFGGLVVLLFFLYVTGLIFLIGAELNAVLQRSYDEETIRYRVEHPERMEDEAARADALHQAERYDQREGTSITESGISRPTPVNDTAPAPEPQAASAGAPEPRRSNRLVTGFTVAGLAGVIGWIVGRHGSRAG